MTSICLILLAGLISLTQADRLFSPYLVESNDPLFPLLCSGKPAGLYLGGLLPNTSLSWSGYQAGHEPVQVRGGVEGYWRPQNKPYEHTAEQDRFIQVDLGTERQVAGLLVATELGEYQTRTLLVRYSTDCVNYQFLRDAGGEPARLDLGLESVNQTWQVFFPRVVVARCVVVTPLAALPAVGPSLELDIVLCGFSFDGVKEDDLSTDLPVINAFDYYETKVGNDSVFYFGENPEGVPIGTAAMVVVEVTNMGESSIVFGVQANGTVEGGSTMYYSTDCENFSLIADDSGNPMVFHLGGSGEKTLFSNPVRARCLRLHQQEITQSGYAVIKFLSMSWYTGLRAVCGTAANVGFPPIVPAPGPEHQPSADTLNSLGDQTRTPFVASPHVCVDGVCRDADCTATLIASQWLVTAARCVLDPATGELLDVENLFVHFRNDKPLPVAAVIAHPLYETKKENDVALIKLLEAVAFTPTSLPACLADKTTFRMDGLRCKVVTRVEEVMGAMGTVFSSVAPTISSESCDTYWGSVEALDNVVNVGSSQYVPPSGERKIKEQQMCLGFPDGTNRGVTAMPGSGVFCYDLSPSRWTLHGVVSWGLVPRTEVAVVTWLPSFSEWIQDVITEYEGPLIPTV